MPGGESSKQVLHVSYSEFQELFGDTSEDSEEESSFHGFVTSDNEESVVLKRSQRTRKVNEKLSTNDDANPYRKVYFNYASKRQPREESSFKKKADNTSDLPNSRKNDFSANVSLPHEIKTSVKNCHQVHSSSLKKSIDTSKKISNTKKVAKDILSKAHKVKKKPVAFPNFYIDKDFKETVDSIRPRRKIKTNMSNDFVYDKRITKKRKLSNLKSPVDIFDNSFLSTDGTDNNEQFISHRKEHKRKRIKYCSDAIFSDEREKENDNNSNMKSQASVIPKRKKKLKMKNCRLPSEIEHSFEFATVPQNKNIFETLDDIKITKKHNQEEDIENIFNNLSSFDDSSIIIEESIETVSIDDRSTSFESNESIHEFTSVVKKKQDNSKKKKPKLNAMKWKAVKYQGEIRFMNSDRRLLTFCGKCVNCKNDVDCQNCTHCKNMNKHKTRLLPCFKRRCLNPIIGVHLSFKRKTKSTKKVGVTKNEDKNSDVDKIIKNSCSDKNKKETENIVKNQFEIIETEIVGTIPSDNPFEDRIDSIIKTKRMIESESKKRLLERSENANVFVKSPIKPKLRSAINVLTTTKSTPKLPLTNAENTVMLPWPHDSNEDAAWVSGHHLCFTKPMRAPLLGLCFLCGSAGKETMFRCSSCCECFHPYCLDIDPIDGKEWFCDRCKRCVVCGLKENLLMCDKCHDCYHGECLGPFYQRDTEGVEETWVCGKCVKCSKCGSKRPGKSKGSQWKRDFSMCEQCDYNIENKNFCPICEQIYDENDDSLKMMFCLHCEQWIHMECEGITRDDYEILADLPESIPYICKLCSTHDQKQIYWYKEVKEELYSGFSKIFYDIITHIHYKTVSSFSTYNKVVAQCVNEFDDLIIRLDAKSFTCVTDFYNAGMSVFLKLRNVIVHNVNISPLAESIIELFDKAVISSFPWFVKDPVSAVEKRNVVDDVIHPREGGPINFKNADINIQHDHVYSRNEEKQLSIKLPLTQTIDYDMGNRYCLFCLAHGDGEENGAGRLLYAGMNNWVHINCALWSAEVFEDDQGRLKQVNEALKRGNKLKCESCNRYGASIGCCFLKCIRSYHFECAKDEGVTFLDDKRIYCQEHASKADPKLVLEEEKLSVPRRVLVDLTRFKSFKGIQSGVDIYTLRVSCGNLFLQELGQLSKESDLKNYLAPDGYRINRLFWSTKDPMKICRYTCDIRLPFEHIKTKENNVNDGISNKTYCHDQDLFYQLLSKYEHLTHCPLNGNKSSLPLKRKLIDTFDIKNGCPKCLFNKSFSLYKHSDFILNMKTHKTIPKENARGEKHNNALPINITSEYLPFKDHFPLYTTDSQNPLGVKEEIIDIIPASELISNLTVSPVSKSAFDLAIPQNTQSSIPLLESVNTDLSTIKTDISINAAKLLQLANKVTVNDSNLHYKTNIDKDKIESSYKILGTLEQSPSILQLENDIPSTESALSPILQAAIGGAVRNYQPKNGEIVSIDKELFSSSIEQTSKEDYDLIRPREKRTENINHVVTSDKQIQFDVDKPENNSVSTHLSSNSTSFFYPKSYKQQAASTNTHQTQVVDNKTISANQENSNFLNSQCNKSRHEFLFTKLRNYLKSNPQAIQIVDEFSSQKQNGIIPVVNLTDKNSKKNLICYSAQLPEDLWNELINAGVAQTDIQKVIQVTGRKTFFGKKNNSPVSHVANSNLKETKKFDSENCISLTSSINEMYQRLSSNHQPHVKNIQPNINIANRSLSPINHQYSFTSAVPLVTLQSHQSYNNQYLMTIGKPLSNYYYISNVPQQQILNGVNLPAQQIFYLANTQIPQVVNNFTMIQEQQPTIIANNQNGHQSVNLINPQAAEPLSTFSSKPLGTLDKLYVSPIKSPEITSSPKSLSQYISIAPKPTREKSSKERAKYINSDTNSIICNSSSRTTNTHDADIKLDFSIQKDSNKIKHEKHRKSTKRKVEKSIDRNQETYKKRLKLMLQNKEREEIDKTKTRMKFIFKNEFGWHMESHSLERIWKSLMGKINELRLSANLSPLQVDPNDAFDFLGLNKEFVSYLIEQLPGGHKCRSYRFQHHLPRVGENEEDVVVNPSGCARSEVYKRKRKADIFAWLASPYRKPPEYVDDGQDDDVSGGPQDLPTAMKYRFLKNTAKNNVGVYRSPIQGRGLFCKHPIELGEMIIEYSGETIRASLTDRRERFYDEKGYGCYMFRIDDTDVVDATLKGNAARFINHSCEPNCFSRIITVDGSKKIVIYAARRINAGEELTYDYKFALEDDKLPCYCGAKKCRKYLN